jgi:sec-independent protein translocase protein TatA
MMTILPLFIGTSELLLIAALVLLLFGGKKLPEMMRGLGQGVKAFKEGMNDNQEKNPQEHQSEASANAQQETSANAQEQKPSDGQQETE